MVRRPPHEPKMQLRPGLERLPTLDQLGIIFCKLPASVDPPAGVGACKRQRVNEVGLRLEVVERCHRTDRMMKSLVGGHIGDTCSVNMNMAAVLQAPDVFLSGFYRNHFLFALTAIPPGPGRPVLLKGHHSMRKLAHVPTLARHSRGGRMESVH